jgi:hypothetical protein
MGKHTGKWEPFFSAIFRRSSIGGSVLFQRIPDGSDIAFPEKILSILGAPETP